MTSMLLNKKYCCFCPFMFFFVCSDDNSKTGEIMCDKHDGTVSTWYCTEHDKFFCKSCMEKEHRLVKIKKNKTKVLFANILYPCFRLTHLFGNCIRTRFFIFIIQGHFYFIRITFINNIWITFLINQIQANLQFKSLRIIMKYPQCNA
jgi:hypothetical protein